MSGQAESLVHIIRTSLQGHKSAAKENVLAYRTLLSETRLAEGLSNVGDSRRMERFVQKLLNGRLNHLASLAIDEYSCKLLVQAYIYLEG